MNSDNIITCSCLSRWNEGDKFSQGHLIFSRSVFVKVVILILIPPSIPAVFGQALSKIITWEDFQYLQSQDKQSYQNSLVKEKMARLEKSTELLFNVVDQQDAILTRISQNVSIALAFVQVLDLAFDEMELRLNNVSVKVYDLNYFVDLAETRAMDLSKQVDGLNGAMLTFNKTIHHLHQVNQIWKHNFRIINSTFKNIKKKVDFSSPNFENN